MEHTLALIGRAHQGDKEARDTLFEENTGLIYSVARRFLGRGVEMEDLFQIGSIGLLKAVDKFDPAFEVKFSTYAIPMILGELKRFFRDDGMIKVSRSDQRKPAQSLSGERKDRERTGQGTEPQRNRRNARNAARRSRDDDGLSGRSRIPVQNRLSERGNRHLPHRQDPGKRKRRRASPEPDLPRGNPRKTGILRPQTSLHALLPGPDPDPDRRTARRFPGAGVADGEEDIEEAEEFVSRWMITLFLDARYADYIKSPASIYM